MERWNDKMNEQSIIREYLTFTGRVHTEPNYVALSLTEKNIYGKLTLPFGNVILPCYFPS